MGISSSIGVIVVEGLCAFVGLPWPAKLYFYTSDIVSNDRPTWYPFAS
jgi:hypothetical protein